MGKHAASANDAVNNNQPQPTQVMSSLDNPDLNETRAIPIVPEQAGSEGQTAFMPDDGGFVPFSGDAPMNANEGFAGWTDVAPKKKGRGKKIALIVLGVIVAVLAVVYIAGIVFFSGHFYPKTTLAAHDVSMKSSTDVASFIQKNSDAYTLKVTGDGLDFSITAAQAGLLIDSSKVASEALADNAPWKWPYEVFLTHDETMVLAAEYNSGGLRDLVNAKVEAVNATAVDPVNATIAYTPASKQFTVAPEKPGTRVDAAAALNAIDDALVVMEPSVTLGNDQLVQPSVLSTEPRLQAACDSANKLIRANVTLVLAGTVNAGSINADQISQWVMLNDNLEASFNDEAMTTWVQQFAEGLNTVGSERTYTRPDGKVITVSGGSYGWEIDNDALVQQVKDAVNAGATLTIDVPCTQTAATYAGPGLPDWGPRYIDIDLAEQHVYMYDSAGALIWDTDCISGIPDGIHDTPTGVFYVTRLATNEKLIGYDTDGKTKIYESYVDYWIPFSGNVFAMHDATWQPGFGGSMYANGYGSHGCVNLSYSAAQSLFSIAEVGDTVISHW